MEIFSIQLNNEQLWEHRHLFTDDNNYNSLIVSNIIGYDVHLVHHDANQVYYGEVKKHCIDNGIFYSVYFLEKNRIVYYLLVNDVFIQQILNWNSLSHNLKYNILVYKDISYENRTN